MKIRNQLVKSRAKTSGEGNPCTSITVHETANTSRGANAQAHANLQSSGNVRQASWHITVDDKEAIRSFPDTVKCWHAGNATGNATSIGIEICVNSDGNYEKALANAAEVVKILRKKHGLGRAAVKQHQEWSGKNCPTKLRASGRWKAFVAATDPTGETPDREEPTVGKMVSPMEGRRTYGRAGTKYGKSYAGHAGLDIGPPTPGQVGIPVYAAFAGTVRGVRTNATSATRVGTSFAPGRTGNQCLVSNPDGEGQLYNHMKPVVKVGQKVKAGQLLGHIDRSGNQQGTHLHFECWSNWRNPNSHFDPEVLFAKYGIKVGSKPKGTSGGGSSSGGGSAPKVSLSKAEVKRIQKALNSMGYDAGPEDGIYGSRTADAVGSYQGAQKFGGLKKDRIWGAKTQAHYDWTKKLQRAFNTAYGRPLAGPNRKCVVDGDYRQKTAQFVLDLKQARPRLFKKKDGKAGPVAAKLLNIPNHP